MRRSNRIPDRFRLSADEVLEAAACAQACGIATILLQGGEDVGSDRLLDEVLPRIKRELKLYVILNVGERTRSRFEQFRRLGADAFIMKFEASNPALYAQATHGSLMDRLENLRRLRDVGFVVGTGNIVGLPGQTLEHLADDLLLACELGPDYLSSSPFIPNEGTPWEREPVGDLDTTLNFLAASRILLERALIPSVSALEKVRPGGQLRGLLAGANVMTVNCTPSRRRDQYRIYSRERFVVTLGHVGRTLEAAGLDFVRGGILPAPQIGQGTR